MRFDAEARPGAVPGPSHRARRGGAIGQGRLGNNIEAATPITAGPFASQVAILDGYDVIAVPVHAAQVPATRLFGIEPLAPDAFASGLVYLPSERQFFFDFQGQPHSLWIADEAGNPRPPRAITYLEGFDPATILGVEGMTYIPRAGSRPARIARATYIARPDETGAQIEVIGLDGVVSHEIGLGPPLDGPDTYVLGVAYVPQDEFVVSLDDGSLWRVGADGAVRGGPTTAPDLPGAEALTRLEDGRFFAAGYTGGRLLALTAELVRSPADDRSVEIGPGLSRVLDGAWDPATGSYVLIGIGRDATDIVASVPRSLDDATTLFTLPSPAKGLALLPAEDAFALGRLDPPFGIDIVHRDGAAVGQILFQDVDQLPNRRITALSYLPSTNQFVVQLRRNSGKAWLISRSGHLDGSISLPGPGGALQLVNDGGRECLGLWTPPTLYLLDRSGSILRTSTPSTEDLLHPWGYVAGPDGEIVLFDGNNSEGIVRGPAA
jgi:hypothetical protein